MRKFNKLLLAIASLTFATVVSVPAPGAGQGLDPASLTKQSTDSWPTYSGDYSGRRFSPLTQINQSNVKSLALAWVTHVTAGEGTGGGPSFGPPSMVSVGPTITGGEASQPVPGMSGTARIGGAILEFDGILYATSPDNAWAVDARDGTVLWHYFWKTKGGTHIGNRGAALYGDWLYFETPDDYLVSLDARTGHERWHKVISDFDEQYFSTMAPMVIGNHLLVGTGDDLDAPGFLQSFDPETGDLQWKWYSEPEKMGDPGSETWPNLDAMRHGGAGVWVPGSYDPDLHLYYFGTANPTPGYSGATRKGDDLYTSCLIALNVDSGKIAWYFQPTPHDTHDWDAAQTPVMVDAIFDGKARKLLVHADRNGYFFVLDRVTGQNLVSVPFTTVANWALGLNTKGEPIENPEKEPTIGGSLVSGDGTNWPPPSFDPQTGLFYVPTTETYGENYLMEPDPKAVQGLGGVQQQMVGSFGSYIAAIDYRDGKVVWKHLVSTIAGPGGSTGLLTTAGKLLFAGISGNFEALDPANGRPLWHARLGQVSNAAETYMLDGHQYVLVAAGDAIYSFSLN